MEALNRVGSEAIGYRGQGAFTDASTGSDATSRQAFGFRDIIFLLRRNAIFVFTIIVLGMFLAVVVIARTDRIYTSSAVLVLDPGSTTFDTVTSRLRTVDPAVTQTEVEILRSRRLAYEVAEELGLFTSLGFAPGPKSPSLADQLLARVLPSLESSADAVDEADGAEVSNTVPQSQSVTDMQGGVPEGAEGSAQSSGNFAEAGRDADREAVIDKLLGIYSVQPTGQSLAIQINATHSNPFLAAEIANTVAELYIEDTLQNQRAGIENAIEFLSRRAASAKERLSSLRTELTTLIRLNALDDSDLTETMIAELSSLRVIVDLENNQSDNGLAAQIERITEALRERTRAELERSELELALEIERQRFQSISERLGEYETQRDALTAPARMISFAQPADEPTAPRPGLALAVSFVVLTSCAFVFSLARAGLDSRIWTVRSAAEMSTVPGLGAIPKLPRRVISNQTRFWKYLEAQPYSPFAESVRALAPEPILWNGVDVSSSVMLVSASPGAGKTRIAVALATLAAQDGLHVLLIDLDNQTHGASKLIGVPASSTKLEDALETPDTFFGAIQKNSKLNGLHVLSFDKSSHFGRKLTFSPKVEEEINSRLRETYDLIILDTPEEQAVVAGRFSSFVDRAILVVRWGDTKAQDLQNTAAHIKNSGLVIEGCVVNGVDLKKSAKLGYHNAAAVNLHKLGY